MNKKRYILISLATVFLGVILMGFSPRITGNYLLENIERGTLNSFGVILITIGFLFLFVNSLINKNTKRKV
jgi:hypothetical protein